MMTALHAPLHEDAPAHAADRLPQQGRLLWRCVCAEVPNCPDHCCHCFHDDHFVGHQQVSQQDFDGRVHCKEQMSCCIQCNEQKSDTSKMDRPTSIKQSLHLRSHILPSFPAFFPNTAFNLPHIPAHPPQIATRALLPPAFHAENCLSNLARLRYCHAKQVGLGEKSTQGSDRLPG